jgi:carboxymethylenebutenolidase
MTDKPRLTSKDFDPQILSLFDQYVHGQLDRRGFLGASAALVGVSAASGLLAALAPQFAAAEQVAAKDPRIAGRRVDFASPKGYGKCQGYLVKPAKVSKPAPLVLVAHENRGLNPHIEDVARRFAVAGYTAFAPDALHPLGGYPGDEDAARAAFGKLDQDKVKQDFLAAASYLRGIDGGNGRLGVVGFCWGGGIANFLAASDSQVVAAAPFYGVPPPLELVPHIRAELLVVLAADDERVNGAWPGYRSALEKAGVKFELFQPADTVHGFHNDTTPRYNEAAAHAAWDKTLALFDRRLRAIGVGAAGTA